MVLVHAVVVCPSVTSLYFTNDYT